MDETIRILKQLGLSRSAALCYLHLVQTTQPQATAWVLEELSMKPASVYRALHELQTKGFINSHKLLIGGKMHRAEKLSQALDNYALYQRTLALPLIKQLNDR